MHRPLLVAALLGLATLAHATSRITTPLSLNKLDEKVCKVFKIDNCEWHLPACCVAPACWVLLPPPPCPAAGPRRWPPTHARASRAADSAHLHSLADAVA
jgi:hypothetical protein